MKLPTLLICMVCVMNVAATGSAQTSENTCGPEQSFSALHGGEFEAIAGYGKNMSFPPDYRQDWLSGVDGAFSCVPQDQPMRWQAPGAQALEAMRLLPSYPSSNNPSVLSSGWRRLKAE
ncbi:hypothetical protein LKR43_04835 [Pusillimonas sp. MFBS29]|uniref:hypothetical protein n=1 Tax=Pusillimonas sp. MFBS29 TaxID=2886690 RepID=UPI001D125C41|nr:hypothetical protein [Pusillimonas sp. MFBS29]MCC2595662.1 hypothetical protein [Pusillimonas sp. MFBS29]